MEEDREDDVVVPVTLDEATAAQLQRRAESAGRTLEKQILYVAEVVLGLTLPDPGDRAATQHRQLYRRMFARTPLNG
jgi:hypothetical protein